MAAVAAVAATATVSATAFATVVGRYREEQPRVAAPVPEDVCQCRREGGRRRWLACCTAYLVRNPSDTR